MVDAAEVDRVKPVKPRKEEDEDGLDALDDPVRMYLKQMGAVPLLTREQEVEISKRIEAAETELRKIVYGFGFTGKEHLALAEKLLVDPPANALTAWCWTRKWPAATSTSRPCAGC